MLVGSQPCWTLREEPQYVRRLTRGDEACIHCGEAPLVVEVLALLFHRVRSWKHIKCLYFHEDWPEYTHTLHGNVWSQRTLHSQEQWAKLSTVELTETKGTPCFEFQPQCRGPGSG